MKPDAPTFTADGLSDTIAAERLRLEGPNELHTAKPKSLARITVDVVPEFFLNISFGWWRP